MGPVEAWSRIREASRRTVERVGCGIQSPRWDRKRLRSQLTSASTDLDSAKAALAKNDWSAAGASLRRHFCHRPVRFPIESARRTSITDSIREQFPTAADEARASGDRLLEGHRHLLGYDDLLLGSGESIDWHFDAVHNRRAPARFWADVPYLDPQFGDHKIIWELNRHQHWLALGRAAWLTGDGRYTDAFKRELGSWFASNPPLIGVNWASMLELGFRTLSWLWSLHFFNAVETESDDTTWLVDILLGLDAQLNHIARHLSTYFSPNTHLLGEGLALYVAGRTLPELAAAPRWEAIGRQILRTESRRQVCRDGGHAERSAHYHRYAFDFYLLALTIGRLTGDRDAGLFAEITSRMATFCRALASDAGHLPTIGDDDGGLLFPICGRRPADVSDSLAVAAALLQRPDLAIGDPPEETLWMLGGDRSLLRWPTSSQSPPSCLFEETGYAVLRSRTSHLIVDVGRHGFLNGGHAHADALSLVMSIDGRPLLVDPGTSTYTMSAERRNLYRSTFMHNTLTVDGRQQSTPASPFHWRSRANASLRLWRTGDGFDVVEGEHDGYAPDLHRRAVLRDASGLCLIADHFFGQGNRRLDVRWHFDSAWHVTHAETSAAALRHRDGHEAGIASTGSKLTYGEGGAFGWRAPVYGQHEPGLTIEISDSAHNNRSLVTAIAAGRMARDLSVDPVRVATSDGLRHNVAVLGRHGNGRFLAIFSTDRPGAAEAAVRSVQVVEADGIRFHTDARIAVLVLSPLFEPRSLTMIDGSLAEWAGPRSFHFDRLPSAADLHLDNNAIERLSHARRQPRSAAESAVRTICAE